jgi:hypothetical protein
MEPSRHFEIHRDIRNAASAKKKPVLARTRSGNAIGQNYLLRG